MWFGHNISIGKLGATVISGVGLREGGVGGGLPPGELDLRRENFVLENLIPQALHSVFGLNLDFQRRSLSQMIKITQMDLFVLQQTRWTAYRTIRIAPLAKVFFSVIAWSHVVSNHSGMWIKAQKLLVIALQLRSVVLRRLVNDEMLSAALFIR